MTCEGRQDTGKVETSHILFEVKEDSMGFRCWSLGHPSRLYLIYHDIYHVLIDIVSNRLDRQIIKPVAL